ncbi:hypothetical protein [Streptomyces parvus]|uniref:hypothetical protein n=1 Tax=Streptomyces parvus TaxID=66428 RepID=UPI0021006A3A|nr:hypothetical protein [Streptomyces parvus]MCQ1575399.1 hypothetical protein [Streptomyces parvus]
MSARDDLTTYATTTRTITADSLAPYIDAFEVEATTSTRAALSDRAAENRQLRREAARAANLIEKGETAQAVSLLRSLAL